MSRNAWIAVGALSLLALVVGGAGVLQRVACESDCGNGDAYELLAAAGLIGLLSAAGVLLTRGSRD